MMSGYLRNYILIRNYILRNYILRNYILHNYIVRNYIMRNHNLRKWLFAQPFVCFVSRNALKNMLYCCSNNCIRYCLISLRVMLIYIHSLYCCSVCM